MSDNIKVIDSFLPEQEFVEIYNIMSGTTFPWYLNNYVVVPEDGQTQFIHNFYKDSSFIGDFEAYVVKAIVTALKPAYSVYPTKVKSNLLLKTSDIIQHKYHVDIENVTGIEQAKTGILYMNTNNGYTVFETGQKVESVRNRYVEFPAWYKHTGTTTTDKDFRMVINFNYINEAIKNE